MKYHLLLKTTIACLTLLAIPTVLMAQVPKDPKKAASPAEVPTPTQSKTPDPNFVRWRVFLDTLAQEAKSVPDERRPYVVADVAAAYAEFDKDEALRLFTQALEEAFRFRQQDPSKYEVMLQYVLQTGSKKGSGEITVALVSRLKKLVEADKDNTAVKPYEADKALLEGTGVDEDLRRRAELAKSVAPRGLREGTGVMQLIFNLVESDKALADDVFITYLNKAATDETIPIGALFQMEGYAFGYSEFRYFSENNANTSMNGAPRFRPNPAIPAAFLSLMQRRITAALDQAESTGVTASDPSLILMLIKVLSQDAERAVPQMLPVWQQLEQRALIGRTPDQLKAANTRADNILNNRARDTTRDPDAEKRKAEDETDAMLADMDKVVGNCQRDIVYTRAAINLMTRNPKRSEEIIDKISDGTKATNLRDIMYSRRAEDLVEKDDIDAGTALIAKISSPSIKGLATAHLAQVLVRKKQVIEGGRAADEAAKLFDKMDAQQERAAHLFGLAVLLLKTDQREAAAMLERAIKVFNKTDPQDRWRFANTMEVVMSCPDDKNNRSVNAWGGRFSEVDILETITAFAKEDLNASNSASEDIADKPTRLRAQAIIAKSGLAKYKPK